MRRECIQAVSAALSRELNQTEARDIEQRVVRAARELARQDPQAWLAKSKAQRLTEAGQRAAKELIGEAQLKAEREALQIAANVRFDAHASDMAKRGMDRLEALDRKVAFHADGKTPGISIESQAKAIRNDFLRQLIPVMEASNPKWFGLLENREGVEAIIKEINGEDSGVPAAKAGAKIWKEVAERARQRFNAAGGDIGKLDDWGMPHHHSQVRVARAGRAEWLKSLPQSERVKAELFDRAPPADWARAHWVDDILPKLDRSKYLNEDGTRMDDAQLREFLEHAWTTIATGGANKVEPGQARGAGARANRGNASRQIHFKDAKSYIDYQGKFGEKSMFEVLIGHIEGISKDIAMVEEFGPNPDHTFRYQRDKAVTEAKLKSPADSGQVDKRSIRTENLYNEVAGKRQPVASERLANTFDTLRNWLTASRLGGAVISSLTDDATLHLTGHVNNLPAMKLLANELAALNPANKMEERLANRAGLGLNTFISSINRFGQDGLGASFSKKLANTVMRAQGLNAITEARRRAFGATMMSALGSVTKNHAELGKLDPKDKRILEQKGVTDEDFNIWKAAKLEDWGGGNDTMLTPDAIYRIPDAKIDQALGQRMVKIKAKADPEAVASARMRAREQAVTKLLGSILEETDVAVIEPGAKERAFMGAGIQRGTWKGELARSFFLFKSFPIAMLTRHWARGMAGANGMGKAPYLATLIAATTILGAAAMQVKEVLAGRDPRNLNIAKKHGVRNWLKAFLQGGSLGIYGDFLFSEATQHGQSPVASFLGPVVGLGEDAFKLTQGNIMQAAAGKKTDAGAELAKFVQGNTPGANLWYAKGMLDHMIFHQLQEHLSPGYLSRMRKRSYKEFGQRYWWEPGQMAPSRAPDFEAVAGN